MLMPGEQSETSETNTQLNNLKVSVIQEGKNLTIFGITSSKSGACIHFRHETSKKNGFSATKFNSKKLSIGSNIIGLYENKVLIKKGNT